MKHVGDTKRMRIFEAHLCPTDHNTQRALFVAFRTDEDRPMVLLTALVNPTCPVLGGVYVDWLEVASEHRRRGFAAEFWDWLALHYCNDKLLADAATEAGEEFLEWVGAK